MATKTIRATGSSQDIRVMARTINTLAAAVVELQTNFDAVLAKLDAESLAASDYVSTSETSETVDTLQVRF